MIDYTEFLKSKVLGHKGTGLKIPQSQINPMLYDFQNDIDRWALSLGKAAVFAECGLGKTPIQLEWAHHISANVGPVLILAPLAVAGQTVREGVKFGIEVKYVRSQADVGNGISISNYEMLDHFDPSFFKGVVLDESSILKAFTGKTKQKIIDTFVNTPFKLACTATPAPNDYLELGNHSQFLDVMPSNEMISRWFINDTMQAGGYRLKGHAEDDFWRWLTSWAVCMSKPSDLGYDDAGFSLPPLNIITHTVAVDHSRAWENGRLLLDAKLSATDMWREKRETSKDRSEMALQIANEKPNEPWIIWCDTNYEADDLKTLFPEAIEVRGSHSIKQKEELLTAFSEQRERIIITKPSIAGFGLNWQHCRNQIFVGVTYSFERFYQALRRSWRYMVEGEVNVHLVNAESEGNILESLQSKQADFAIMQAGMNKAMKRHGLFRDGKRLSLENDIQTKRADGENWTLYLGDCVMETRKQISDNSMDLSVFSPPFSSLYIYSDSIADMGNSADHAEFFAHFDYLTPELYRVGKPGSFCAVHCKDLPLYMNRDGAAGLYDFPGDLISSMERGGWTFSRWVTIWKDPVIEMQRTKNHGLLHKNFVARGEVTRQGMADYVLIFQKAPGGNILSRFEIPRLPIQVITRAVELWTNDGEVVISAQDAGRNRVYKQYVNGDDVAFSIFDLSLDDYTPEFIMDVYKATIPGRLSAVHCMDIPTDRGGKINMASEVIRRFSQNSDFVFHSRLALTDGTSLIVFRKWGEEFADKQVQNYPQAPQEDIEKREELIPAGIGYGRWTESEVYYSTKQQHPNYIGTEPPQYWDSQEWYTINVWQKYASPVWFDLVGLPKENPDIWFDINQTNVLNCRQARGNKDEKHICPLQLDLIDKLVREYSKKGDIVFSPFSGIGSEGRQALLLGRKFAGIELKLEYFEWAIKHLQEAEYKMKIPDLFTWAAQQQSEV